MFFEIMQGERKTLINSDAITSISYHANEGHASLSIFTKDEHPNKFIGSVGQIYGMYVGLRDMFKSSDKGTTWFLDVPQPSRPLGRPLGKK